jgi:hypothetical protein
LLTRAALIWRGFQIRDREGAVEVIDFFTPSRLHFPRFFVPVSRRYGQRPHRARNW